MGYRIQNRRDTAARWAEMNPILLEGEIGLVTDNANQYKVGDGIHAWNDLPLRGFTGTISQELGEDENAVVSQKVVTEKLVETEGKLAELGSEVLYNLGYTKKQDIFVNAGVNTGASNYYFQENSFIANKEIAICLIDKNKIVDKYSFISAGGLDVYPEGDLYKYEPNKVYFIKPSEISVSYKTGCYIDAKNAIGTGKVSFVVSDNLEVLVPYVLRNHEEIGNIIDILGVNLLQRLSIKNGEATTGSNSKNLVSKLNPNKKVFFTMLCDDNIVNNYAVITSLGLDIENNSNYYRFKPNKIYSINSVSQAFLSSNSFGCYVDNNNAIGNGESTFVLTQDCNTILSYLYSKEPFIEEKKIFNTIGFDLIQEIKVIQGENTTGSNGYFEENTFESDKIIPVLLLDNNNAVKSYWIGTTRGKDIENNYSDLYRFKPNKLYFIKPHSNAVVEKIGCYIDAANAVGSGSVSFLIGKELKGIVESLYNKNSATSLFNNKTFAVLGDSLSATGDWEAKFEKLTGAIYKKGYEKGGTPTLGISGDCGMDRALKLYEEQPDVDVIFVQNINDGNYGIDADGDLSDIPYMMTKNVLSSKVYGTSLDAINALGLEITSITPLVGTMIRLQYGTSAKKITIESKATSNGDIFINIGSSQYGIAVTTDMTIAEIQEAILAYDYSSSGYSDTDSGTNAVLFADNLNRGSDSPSISVNVGSTGISITISDATTVNYEPRCFIGKNINEWTDTTKWVHKNSIKRYSQYKGLINWLQTKFPNALIYFVGLPRHSWDDSTPKYADGTFNWDEYRTSVGWDWLFDCQKKVAEYLNIPYLNIKDECGISIFNASAFYPKANVHPNNLGYERWGETLARIIE